MDIEQEGGYSRKARGKGESKEKKGELGGRAENSGL